MKTITIELNCDLLIYKSGQQLKIRTDELGTPLEGFWRARLKDSEFDNCIKIVNNKKGKKNDRINKST